MEIANGEEALVPPGVYAAGKEAPGTGFLSVNSGSGE
jgi:hypothetical protein